jgi:hypothetical protein
MLDWLPYDHNRARRGLLALSVAIGLIAGLADMFLHLTSGSGLPPLQSVGLTIGPFVVVAVFVVFALLRKRWRGPHSLVIQPDPRGTLGAFAAVRPVAIVSLSAMAVFWMLELLGRATAALDEGLLWTVVLLGWIAGAALISFTWITTARRVVLTPAGLIVRRGLRTRSIAWTQLGNTGPATPSHQSVGIMLWVAHPNRTTPEAYGLQEMHLSISPAFLAHAIRIYCANPDRRGLIGSPEELDRLMNELDPVHYHRHGILG